MGLSKVQRVLLHLLKEAGADQTMTICIMLALKKSDKAMIDLLLYIYDNKPSVNEISEKFLDILYELPPELRTGQFAE